MHYRVGQAIFNIIYSFEPFTEFANKVRGTFIDCFYKDENIPLFIGELKNAYPFQSQELLHFYLKEYLKDIYFLLFIYNIISDANNTHMVKLNSFNMTSGLFLVWEDKKLTANFFDLSNGEITRPLANSQRIMMEEFILRLLPNNES